MALALVAPGSIVALLIYADALRVDWPIARLLAVGGFAPFPAGIAAARLRPGRLRLAFFGWLGARAPLPA